MSYQPKANGVQPADLLKMYRQRSNLTQDELAVLLDLQSSRVIRAWEAGESTLKPERLQKLIEVYLTKGIFIAGHEREEAAQLWQSIKDMFDLTTNKLTTYPIFDKAWFETILTAYQSPPAKSNPTQPTVPASVAPELVRPRLLKLPQPANRLIGRDSDIERVAGLLTQAETRLVTLTGTGGVGKTRLALAVAGQLAEAGQFAGGVAFVDLSPLREAGQVLPAIVQTLEIRSAEEANPTARSSALLKTFLEAKDFLLILDNFEQVIDAAASIGELLTDLPRLKLIVTSREVLGIYREYRYSLAPLPVCNPAAGDYSPAIQLFVERAKQLNPDFGLTEQNQDVITEICSRLDGLPLALELAARRTALFAPDELLERLSQRFSLLKSALRDLPPRHQTLLATLDWSYQLLKPAEQLLLRALAVFSSCSLESLTAVCAGYPALDEPTELVGLVLRLAAGEKRPLWSPEAPEEILEGLTSLLDKSLLQVGQAAGSLTTLALGKAGSSSLWRARFRLLETVREYALEQLRANQNEQLRLHLAQSCYYLQLLSQAVPRIGDSFAPEWIELVETEHNNLQGVLGWLVATISETPEADRENLVALYIALVARLAYYWIEYVEPGENMRWLEQAAEFGQPFLPRWETEKESAALVLFYATILQNYWVGLQYQQKFGVGQEFLRRSLAIFERFNEQAGQGMVLTSLGWLANFQGRLDEARGYIERSLVLEQALGRKKRVVINLVHLTGIVADQHDYEWAKSLTAQALEIARELRDDKEACRILSIQASIARDQAAYGLAQTLLEEALTLCRPLKVKWQVCKILCDLGDALYAQGQYDEALNYLQESLPVARQLGEKVLLALLTNNLGCTYFMLGNLAEAGTYLEESLKYSQEWGNKELLGDVLLHLGRLAFDQEDYARAEDYYNQALEAHQEAEIEPGTVACLMELVCLAVQRGDFARARTLAALVGDRAAGLYPSNVAFQTRYRLFQESLQALPPV